MSFATWLKDKYSVRVVTLIFCWALFLVPSFIIFNESLLPIIILGHLIIFVLPFLYKDMVNKNGFSRFQLFYLVPLLVSASLNSKYWRAEYLLQIIVMYSTAFICAIEIAKDKEELHPSSKSFFLCLVALFAIWVMSEVVLVYHVFAKYVTLFSALLVFAIVKTPADKLSRFKAPDYYKKWKIFGLVLAIIVVHVGIFINGGSNFLFYVAYVFSVINLCFLCSENKTDFWLIAGVVILLSLTPFGPKEVHFDSLILSSIFVLFHLSSPVLYYKKNKHGVVKVEYDYVHNKVLLVNDGIIQGEKLLDDNASLRLRYFGGKDTGSIIFNVFRLLKGQDANIGVLGLGTGTLAMFGRKRQTMHFYEINPEVVKVAYDRRYFDYIGHSDAKVKVILGDAREKLTEAKDGLYNLICVDVYFGNSVPNHFLTLEALQMYTEKLTKDGLILIHTTGPNAEVYEKRIAAISEKLKLPGLVAYERYIEYGGHKKTHHGLVVLPDAKDIRSKFLAKIESLTGTKLRAHRYSEETYSWIVLTKNKKHFNALLAEKRWYRLDSKKKSALYTDDMISYSLYGGVITDGVD